MQEILANSVVWPLTRKSGELQLVITIQLNQTLVYMTDNEDNEVNNSSIINHHIVTIP